MRLVAAVALGGALGSVARWLVAGWVQRRASIAPGWIAIFPVGTFVVNVVGCLAIGAVAALLEERLAVDPAIRAFLLLGLLGGFTTFSTFAWESSELLRGGGLLLGLVNLTGSAALGLVGVWLGAALARTLAGGGG